MDAQNLDLGFVEDHAIRLVLENCHSQATKAFGADSYLGSIVTYGAVAEGLLTWALLQREADALKASRAAKDKQGRRTSEAWYSARWLDYHHKPEEVFRQLP
jgi:hypothetical protein